jgi:C4-dicarboxylate-specific signal transduction histidine kinase
MEKNNFDEILNNTIEGILLVEDGFIKDVNNSLVSMLEYKDKNDLIGNLATGIVIPSSYKKFIDINNYTFQEISLLTKTGSILPSIMKMNNIKMKNKTYKMVSILDISQLKQTQNLLVEKSRLADMGEMISVIAHQWRQPLNAIGSMVSRLKLRLMTEKFDKELFLEKFEQINDSLQYMSKTVDDFKDFFIPTQKKELLNLNTIIENSQSIINPALKEKQIKLIFEKSELSNIFAYENELVQIIINIINNAKDALIEQAIDNPIITINLEEEQNLQKIIIEDNAGGIPKEYLNKIFEPYFSTKIKKNGTGLGLYICRIILEKYSKGSISVSNTKTGARFTISIEK